jgi:hypothetical protein
MMELLDFEATEFAELGQMIFRFSMNFLVIWILIHFFYYPKSKRRDYYFTFTLIAVSVFFLIFLLASVKIKIGFALGIFAIFGIIRYRTQSVPIREMTYLFTITAISVINALSVQMGLIEVIVVNLIFILITWILESIKIWKKQIDTRDILYDRIDLISPDKYEELKKDLSLRTGLNIQRVEIESIDFTKNSVKLKIYYYPYKHEIYANNKETELF